MHISPTRASLTAAAAGNFAPGDGAFWHAAGLQYVRQSGATMIPDLPGWAPLGDWDVGHFGAYPGAASAAEARTVAIAMQAAYDAAAAAGQPLHIGAGTWFIHMNSDEIVTATAGNRIAPLRFAADGAVVRGAGMANTIIRCWSGGVYGAISWRRMPLENGAPKITGGLYADFTVDGGVDNPSDATDGFAAGVASNIDGVTFERLRFRNANQYGLGIQNGGNRRALIIDCAFENTGFDGLDFKNNNPIGEPSAGWAMQVVRPRFNNCCRGTYASPGSWLDIMGEGCQVTDATFSGMGTTGNALSLLRIKQGMDATNTQGNGGWRSVVRGMQVEYNAASPLPDLIEVRAPWCVIEDLRQSGAVLGPGKVGVRVTQPFVRVVRPRLQGGAGSTGVMIRQHTGDAAGYLFGGGGGDAVAVEGGVFTGLATAIDTNRARLMAHGNAFPDCVVGIAGGTEGMIYANDFTGCATPLSLTGTTNQVFGNVNVSEMSMRFGAHSALGSETTTGFVEVRDAAGTLRKVAVVS